MVCNIEINNAPKVDPHYPYWVVTNLGRDGIWYFSMWKTKEEADEVVSAYDNKFVVEVM